jgi:hypothetical protein
MVSAKQLRTLGLSWFRSGLYVQQRCARGTILLCTGVPVVGRLQAKRERRRGLQIPRGVIEASANIVGKTRSVPYVSSPAAREITFLLYAKDRAIYRRAALFSYVGRYGVQFRGDDARPGESRFCYGVVACLVLEQGRLRGWRRSG